MIVQELKNEFILFIGTRQRRKTYVTEKVRSTKTLNSLKHNNYNKRQQHRILTIQALSGTIATLKPLTEMG